MTTVSDDSAGDLRRKLARALDMVGELRSELERRGPGDGPDRREPVAIVGVGCRYPARIHDPGAFWEQLRGGAEAISRFPASRWDPEPFLDPDPDTQGKAYSIEGGFIEDIEMFDPVPFRISEDEAVGMDPQQRLVLEVSWEALEQSGTAPDSLSGTSVGVFIGASTNDYVRMRQQHGSAADVDGYQVLGENSLIPGRVAHLLGVHGPVMVVDTACSSSLTAVHLAVRSLRGGDCDLALAGGVNALLSPFGFVLMSKTSGLSPSGRCRAYDRDADGMVRGEGCGVVVLKRLCDAVRDQDDILAVIRGTTINHDGRASGMTVPNGQAQQAVIAAALADAGLDANQVGYVEGHGTGTTLGDPIELQALEATLGASRRADDPVYVGSVKANVGHLEAAAGIIAMTKAALAIRHGEIPPQPGFRAPSENVPWDEMHLAVATEPTPWPQRDSGRVAGVSGFGASGTNAHVVLGEAPQPAAAVAPDDAFSARGVELLPISARTTSALAELARRYAEQLPDGLPIGAVCRTASLGRSHNPRRLAVLASCTSEARARLAAHLRGEVVDGVITGQAAPRHRTKVAFLFSGQGPQYNGMGRRLYQCEPVFAEAIDRCAASTADYFDATLHEVLFEPGDERSLLHEFSHTGPAMIAMQYALACVWQSWGIRPGAVMGHSNGEYAAAAVAGVLSIEDAIRLAAVRCRLIAERTRPGALAAVTLTEDEARAAIAEVSDDISIAAINGEFDVVLAGTPESLEKLCVSLQNDGRKCRRLRVSQASHSPLMDPVLDDLRSAVARASFHPAEVPVVSNLTGSVVDDATLADPDHWVAHTRRPGRGTRGRPAGRARRPSPRRGIGRNCRQGRSRRRAQVGHVLGIG